MYFCSADKVLRAEDVQAYDLAVNGRSSSKEPSQEPEIDHKEEEKAEEEDEDDAGDVAKPKRRVSFVRCRQSSMLTRSTACQRAR